MRRSHDWRIAPAAIYLPANWQFISHALRCATRAEVIALHTSLAALVARSGPSSRTHPLARGTHVHPIFAVQSCAGAVHHCVSVARLSLERKGSPQPARKATISLPSRTMVSLARDQCLRAPQREAADGTLGNGRWTRANDPQCGAAGSCRRPGGGASLAVAHVFESTVS